MQGLGYILGVFICSVWDISHNNGMMIRAVSGFAAHALHAVGLL
jgi:hypothetical protein